MIAEAPGPEKHGGLPALPLEWATLEWRLTFLEGDAVEAPFTDPDRPRPAPAPLAPPVAMDAAAPSPAPASPLVQAVDAGQEMDVWWGAYSGRAMWPSFVVCLLLTVGIGVGAWSFYDAYRPNPALVRYAAYGLTGGVWLVQLLRVGYRTVGTTYRLTNRRLLRDRGFGNPTAGWADLDRIKTVEVEVGPLERPAGVGRVVVHTEGGAAPTLVLEGVRDPDRVAELIRRTAAKACQPAGNAPPITTAAVQGE